MHLIKKPTRWLVSRFLILAMLLSSALIYLPASVTATTSFESIKDTVSSSDIGKTNVTHTITASTSLPITAGGYLQIIFPSEFTSVSSANLSCPNSGTPGGAGNTLTCTYAAGLEATSSVIIVTGVKNPDNTGSYVFHVYTKDSGDVEIERASFDVAIISSVLVSASVETTLTFSISGLATSSVVNGVVTTGSSTYKTLDFKVLTPGVPKTLAQRINVGTNATYGYTVTVQQDHNLLSSGGADIDSFKDGVAATTTALAWASPSGTLGQEQTYGHFGITSNDSTLSNGDAYGSALYKGLKNTDPIEIMYNSGPSNGTSNDIGSTTVAYTVEVNPLQESGDYSNTLTYVCTPTY